MKYVWNFKYHNPPSLCFCLSKTRAGRFPDSSGLTPKKGYFVKFFLKALALLFVYGSKKGIFWCNSFLKALSLLFMALPLWFFWQCVERRSIIKRQKERPTMHWRQMKGTSCCKIKQMKINENKKGHKYKLYFDKYTM